MLFGVGLFSVGCSPTQNTVATMSVFQGYLAYPSLGIVGELTRGMTSPELPLLLAAVPVALTLGKDCAIPNPAIARENPSKSIFMELVRG